MISLDNFEKWMPLMAECARAYLNEKEFSEFGLFSEQEVGNQLKALFEKPIANFTAVNEVYFRARWAEVIKTLCPHNALKLLEVATGDADMIPQVMNRTHPDSHYITANINKLLNKSLLHKTKDLHIKMNIIEDDASRIKNHLAEDSVDIIAFQHAINDVVQAILCDREGVDTIYSDWMDTLPKMIEILQKETKQKTLEEYAKTPFLELIKSLLLVLKRNGMIVMNHYMFQLDLDWGYPADLFENFVPMTREWLKEVKGCKEIFFDGFDSNWWIFLQKV